MSDKLIVPMGIPQFTGDLAELERNASALAKDAKAFRDAGAAVHSTFQGLSAHYKAPEADQLFATTAPVATKTDGFADDLEKVVSALNAYRAEIQPLKTKLENLKAEAFRFVESIEGGDDWRKDQGKIDHNNSLWRDVNAAVDAFNTAERACHDKIVALVGGKSLIPDDGTHKPNMYGYKASDLDHAEETPWGSLAERKYTGLAWLGHQIKSFVWDGFIVDGVWGTIKGLGTLVGTDGWKAAGQAWTGLGKLATGLVITAVPVAGAAFWSARDDQLPGWLRDSRTAMKETGKALIAYDQWGKNPARAAGAVSFNVLTTVFTGGSGAAAKGGAAAKAISAAAKVRYLDATTYVGMAGKFGLTKVGDMMSTLKNLRGSGAALRIGDDTFKLADQAPPVRPAGLPDSASPLLGDKGKVVWVDEKTGALFNEHGKTLQPAHEVPKEPSAAERAAAGAPKKTPEKAEVMAGVSARTGSEVRVSLGNLDDRIPRAGGGPADHAPAGAAHEAPGGTAPRMPGGTAHELGRGPSAGHEPPSGDHHTTSGSHHVAETGGGSHVLPEHTPGSGGGHAAGGGHGAGGGGGEPPASGGHEGLPSEEPKPFERGGETEQQIRDLLKKTRTKPADLERALENLAHHSAGQEAADIIASGRYKESANFHQVVSSLSHADKMAGGIEQLRLAERLHASGIRDIHFEIKGDVELKPGVVTSHNTDLDVMARHPDGTVYGYQFKEITAPPERLVKKIYQGIGQLVGSGADVKVFVVDIKGTLAEHMARGVEKELDRIFKTKGVHVIVRVEDGTFMYPPGGKFMPGGAL
ncbi:hypothetical protein [Streptomyces abikoensis]